MSLQLVELPKHPRAGFEIVNNLREDRFQRSLRLFQVSGVSQGQQGSVLGQILLLFVNDPTFNFFRRN